MLYARQVYTRASAVESFHHYGCHRDEGSTKAK